jgi:hypothetical protein
VSGTPHSTACSLLPQFDLIQTAPGGESASIPPHVLFPPRPGSGAHASQNSRPVAADPPTPRHTAGPGSRSHVAAALPLFSRSAAARRPASSCPPYSGGLQNVPTLAVGNEAEFEVELGDDDAAAVDVDDAAAVDVDGGDTVVGRGRHEGSFGIVPRPDPPTRRAAAAPAINYDKLSQPASLALTMMHKASSEGAAQAGKSNRAELRAAASRARFESKATVATANAEASRIRQALSGLESPLRTMAAHSASGKVPDEAVTAIAAAAAECVSAQTAGPAAAAPAAATSAAAASAAAAPRSVPQALASPSPGPNVP